MAISLQRSCGAVDGQRTRIQAGKVGAEGVTGVQSGFQGVFWDIFTDKASNKTDKTSGGTGLCRVLVVAIKYDDDKKTLGRTEDSLNSPIVPK